MRQSSSPWAGSVTGAFVGVASGWITLSAIVLGPPLAIGQETPPVGEAATPATPPKLINDELETQVLNAAGSVRRVQVTLDQSLLVETNKPAVRLQAIAPQVAFVQSVSPKQILISGVSFGVTQVIIWSENDEQQILEVEVVLDLAGLRNAIKAVDPHSQVEVAGVKGNILLTGSVGHPDTIQRIQDIASLFLPPDGQVKNQIRLADDVLNQAFKTADPQGQVQFQNIGGKLVLTGSASGPKAAEKLLDVANLMSQSGALPGAAAGQASLTGVTNHLSIPGEQQVMLRCVVAEVSRNATRELGINGFLAGENFKDAFAVNQIAGIAPQNIGVPEAFPVTQNLPFVVGDGGIPIPASTTLSLGFPRVQMQLFLKAMADNTLLRILAEPNIVAISGETAGFLAGGEFPVPVPQGIDQITIEYKQFGVGLNFTPLVQEDGLIRMRINPEVSELDFSSGVTLQGFSVPGVRVRRAETTVEVGSGQTLAIAGLLDENTRGLATRIPAVGEIPILGALFRSVRYQSDQTELVILVTPEIVSPLNPEQSPYLPTDGHEVPNDLELYTLGLLEGGSSGKSREDSDEDDDEDEGENSHPSRSTSSAAPEKLPTNPEQDSVHGPWGLANAGG